MAGMLNNWMNIGAFVTYVTMSHYLVFLNWKQFIKTFHTDLCYWYILEFCNFFLRLTDNCGVAFLESTVLTG